MYSVLIPVDRNENRAMNQARYVTQLTEAIEEIEATVLYVIPPDKYPGAADREFADVDTAVSVADHLEEAGVPVTRTLGDGSVSAEILRTADERDPDEIVVGGRKRSGVTQVLLGSTALDVMISADRPVTLTGETIARGDEIRRVLLPVDGNEQRARHQAEYAARIAETPGSVEVTVLYVFRHQDYAGAPPHEFEEIDAAVEAAEYLESEDVDVERAAVGGEIAETILDTGDERDADSIVMGGRKRSGVQKVLLGSITRDIVLSTDRPVTVTG
jgi:nucleotide-binding universal stress UspA family protein